MWAEVKDVDLMNGTDGCWWRSELVSGVELGRWMKGWVGMYRVEARISV